MASTIRNPQQPPASQPRSTSGVVGQLETKFSNFLHSLGDLLLDITALEVNTMIVSNISGSKFVAEEAYAELYPIPMHSLDDRYFQHRAIPADAMLRQQYCGLRQKLDIQCHLACERMGISMPSAPDPYQAGNKEIMTSMMSDPEFLRGLRKLSELMAALDGGTVHTHTTDLIYAQTVVQLDGDIINRYHEALMQHPYRQIIIDLHYTGVTSGEKQWHSLLGFIVNIVQDMVKRRGGNPFSFLSKDQSKQEL